jgi:hypothetical protein
MKDTKPPTIPISFRVSQLSHARLHQRAAEAGVSSRVWLDQAILENRTSIVARHKPHPELRPLLFQVNKAGNNINQLAHSFNSMKLKGTISAKDYDTGLVVLGAIRDSLNLALQYARPD